MAGGTVLKNNGRDIFGKRQASGRPGGVSCPETRSARSLPQEERGSGDEHQTAKNKMRPFDHFSDAIEQPIALEDLICGGCPSVTALRTSFRSSWVASGRL